MKLFKTFILSLISITLFFPSVVFAGDNNLNKSTDTLLKNLYLKNSSDFNEITTVSNSSLADIKETLNYSKSLDNKNDPKSISSNIKFNENSCFKVYTLNNPDFIQAFKTINNFNENISSKYNWLYPVYENNILKHVATFSKINNSWDMSGFIENVNPILFNTFINTDKIKEILQKNNINSPSDIKFVKIDKYHLNTIYINQNNKEFIIPFTNNISKTNIENGRVYEVSDLVSKLYDESPNKNTSKDKLGGGLENSTINPLINLSIFTMITSIALLVILNCKKSQNISK